jgi:acyl-CoA thioesterase YciA
VKEYQKITLLPKDTNSHGTIFGGVIMSYIDLAAAACCHDHFRNEKFVTVVVRELTFRAPVFVGDLLSLRGEVLRQGRTSVTVRIVAEVQRSKKHERVAVTEAELVFVAVDERGQKVPLLSWD